MLQEFPVVECVSLRVGMVNSCKKTFHGLTISKDMVGQERAALKSFQLRSGKKV